MEESIRFYTEVLGMRVVEPIEVTPATNGKVATLPSHDSNQLLELNWYEPGTRFGPPYPNGEDLDHLAFDCEDLEKAIAGLQARGVEVIVRLRRLGGVERSVRPRSERHLD